MVYLVWDYVLQKNPTDHLEHTVFKWPVGYGCVRNYFEVQCSLMEAIRNDQTWPRDMLIVVHQRYVSAALLGSLPCRSSCGYVHCIEKVTVA